MTIETALQSNRGRTAFAVVWSAILATCWKFIQSSSLVQALVNHAKQLNWASALLYTTALYLAVLTVLLWLGLAAYLIAIRRFSLQNLARGLAVTLFVLFVAMGIESFVRADHLSSLAEFILRWLPMFASVYAGCRGAVPRKPGDLFSRAAARQ